MYSIYVLTYRGLYTIETDSDREYIEQEAPQVAEYWRKDAEYISTFIENLITGKVETEYV
jgi:DNA replication protein DnaD